MRGRGLCRGSASTCPQVCRLTRVHIAALVGPTGVGKTALALALADHVPLEVVSADSRTVYRGMDIGTAKPTLLERQQVPHHVLDVVDPDEAYSLAVYQEQALAAIALIHSHGRLPLLVGGAGLYVSAVCDGLAIPEVARDDPLRQRLEDRARTEGYLVLQTELAHVDPVSAARIDPKNVRRVIRALEVSYATGRPFSAWQKPVTPPVESVLIGLRLERHALYERIDARIDAWVFSGGFIDEVRGLVQRGYAPTLPSMSGIGYREIAQFLAGQFSLEDAVAQFKQATHQFAKRQMTWFRRDPRVHWLDAATVTTSDVVALLSSSPLSNQA